MAEQLVSCVRQRPRLPDFSAQPRLALYLLYAEQLAEKDRREGSEKVYDERMDMIMEVCAVL